MIPDVHCWLMHIVSPVSASNEEGAMRSKEIGAYKGGTSMSPLSVSIMRNGHTR